MTGLEPTGLAAFRERVEALQQELAFRVRSGMAIETMFLENGGDVGKVG